MITMVETRNISLGGLLFHVELPAYNVLNGYLADLKRVLRGADGQEDIVQEVEYRLAELFSEFMGTSRTVVTLKDVERACRQLGEPTEFGDPDGDDMGQSAHRDSHNTSADDSSRQRRMFRDPDDRVIGGVATGIAHRFGLDPVVVRALAVVLFFISGPVLIVLYGVLWCIIPKARSVSDRVAMKGEPVTVDAIKETIEDQLHRAKEEFENPTATRRFRAWWSRFIAQHLPRFIKACMRTLGWMLILICVLILLAIGGLILSAIITGQWNFKFMF